MKKRKKLSLLIYDSNGYKLVTDSNAKKLFDLFSFEAEEVREVRGQVASLGCATGMVKVILSPKEIGKMKDRDILVSTMTTPDFVPAMKKAAAIITDEGGVTCHAAIVAREMNKPCIIGTKVATKVLSDGDEVEVDADKGIVKILKRTE